MTRLIAAAGHSAVPPEVMQAYESGIPEAVAALLITAWEIPYAPDDASMIPARRNRTRSLYPQLHRSFDRPTEESSGEELGIVVV